MAFKPQIVKTPIPGWLSGQKYFMIELRDKDHNAWAFHLPEGIYVQMCMHVLGDDFDYNTAQDHPKVESYLRHLLMGED